MSDKTDPRVAVLDEVLRHAESGEGLPYRWDAAYALRLLDAADRAAGIVRVDTNDEALVERLAEAVCFNGGQWPCYAANPHRDQARAVLAVLLESA